MCASSSSTSRATPSGSTAANAPRLRGGLAANRSLGEVEQRVPRRRRVTDGASAVEIAQDLAHRRLRLSRLRIALRRCHGGGPRSGGTRAQPERERHEPSHAQHAADPRPVRPLARRDALRCGSGLRDGAGGATSALGVTRSDLRRQARATSQRCSAHVPPRQLTSASVTSPGVCAMTAKLHGAPRLETLGGDLARELRLIRVLTYTGLLARAASSGSCVSSRPTPSIDDRARARNTDGELIAGIAPLLRERHALRGQPGCAFERRRRRHSRLHGELERRPSGNAARARSRDPESPSLRTSPARSSARRLAAEKSRSAALARGTCARRASSDTGYPRRASRRSPRRRSSRASSASRGPCSRRRRGAA